MVSLIQNEFKRRVYEESYNRIQNCLDRLDYDEVWKKPNKNSNSIGNLILHLIGNARQYICSGIGHQMDTRERDKEFVLESVCSKEELVERLRQLRVEIEKVIEEIDREDLTKKYMVQGFRETGMSIIIHVIEHFSYHTGQIALYTKLMKDEDLGFYAGLDLNVKSP